MIRELQQVESGTTREAYIASLIDLARANRNILCLDADTGGLEDSFGAELPDQYLNVGIAEANLLGIAAGLAAAGKIPFVNTMASFATTRACEQLKLDIAARNAPVKIVVTHAGISAGHFGPTHHALEDLAIVRSFPNLTIVTPASPAETALAVRAAAGLPGPCYIRLGRQERAGPWEPAHHFRLGEAAVLREGSTATIAACGVRPVMAALEAAATLNLLGIAPRVLNVHTLKPLDVDAIVCAAKETAGIVTVEEHGPAGGLGGTVCETVCEHAPCPVIRIAVPNDVRGRVGDHNTLLEEAGISGDAVAAACIHLLEKAADMGHKQWQKSLVLTGLW